MQQRIHCHASHMSAAGACETFYGQAPRRASAAGDIMASLEFREGDRVRLFVRGRPHVARIETLTSDGTLAQCSWTERGVKQYVTCPVQTLTKLPHAAVVRAPWALDA